MYNIYKDMDTLARVIQIELRTRKLVLFPIWYREVYDAGSQKLRMIGIQDIKQQIYDYIAVKGLAELIKGIGKYQCASLPDRGQIYGTLAIYRWISEKKSGKYYIRYGCKFDMRKYYESIPQDKIVEWLKKRVKNDLLLWLIETLVHTFKKGLSIGSYLSQYLGNLYLSDLYHKCQEQMYKLRHKKDGKSVRVSLVKHTLFYMDDLLILGTSSRDLMKASEIIIEELRKKRLEVKPDWRCFKINDDTFVDMMGYRIYRDHISIRRKTFLAINRCVKRFRKNSKNIHLARRLLSYKGILEHSDSYNYIHDNDLYPLFRKAKKVVSNYDKQSKILRAAT